ncbi:MAG: hypothetical protein ACJ8AT_18585 [Hyalangium sp.]|uniref:hypothetical protein n=1 Tax=Hyalangium sp. TaxID=2028555 RepID=UPI003899C52F
MRRTTPNPRGMALVMAMIVVVLITLLVAGAISFTGTERSASEVQSQQDVMSSCIQAARNLFLSKVQMTMLPVVDPSAATSAKVLPISFSQDLNGFSEKLNGAQVSPSLRTGHLGELQSWSAKKVTTLDDPMAQVNDNTMVTGESHVPAFYIVTAVCREDTADPASAEREIEFMVRVGF